MIYVFSIGLNVRGREPVLQLANSLRTASAISGAPQAVGMTRGEWQGVKERTLHFAADFGAPDAALVRKRAGEAARLLHQDAVAVLALGSRVWEVIGADGAHVTYSTVADFPLAAGIEE